MTTPGLLQWTGGRTFGTWKSSGHMTLNSTGSLEAAGTGINAGTLVHQTGSVTDIANGTVFTNAAGATYDIRTDAAIN